jgi:hypothetical protein
MKIIHEHSHLNGKEFLQVHHSGELKDIIEVIAKVNGNVFKTSKDKQRKVKDVIDQKNLNEQFKELFRAKGWEEKRASYYATPEEVVAREIMVMEPDDAKDVIISYGLDPYPRSNQTDFQKNGIGIEVQFGKYSFVAYDFFVKHMAFFTLGDINVGVEIIPTNSMKRQMDTGVADYEGEIYNLYRQGRSTPAVPLWVIGIEP